MEATAVPAGASEVRILIIDDDEFCVRALRRVLENQPKVVTFGCSFPQRAIERFDEIKPDLVLLDWHMGKMSGLEFLRGVSSGCAIEDLPPILVMTGDISPDTRSQALAAGAADFLTKPLDASEVILRLRNHLRMRRLHQHVRTEKERLELIVDERTAQLYKTIAELTEVKQQVIAEERMRALSVMAGGVAHDFNNALMVIRGYAELYGQPSGSGHPHTLEDMQNGFENIKLAALDASEIVRRLREFYRPFNSESAERQKTDLNKVIRESLKLAEPKWKTQCQVRSLCVTVETDFQPLPLISAVQAELREVLLNLTFNAVDAMPLGGRIIMRTHATETDVVIEVEDSGTGMTPETCHRCMEPFYTTKGERGTGLGLAITYGIIQRHGGSIKIRSEVNQGTCFTLTLPIRIAPESKHPEAEMLPVMQHLRVLVVDDDPSVCSLLTHYLHEDEHYVATAFSGCEALEKFESDEFDVVITDRVMPKMSGDQLAKAIRERKPGEPIILITGYDTKNVPPEADQLIQKPAGIQTIRDAISRAMSVDGLRKSA